MTDEWGGSAANEWGDDAAKWASEFLATAIDLGYSNMDEGWLIGWFANAIEMSSGKRLGKSEREITASRQRWSGCGRFQDSAAVMAMALRRSKRHMDRMPHAIACAVVMFRNPFNLISGQAARGDGSACDADFHCLVHFRLHFQT